MRALFDPTFMRLMHYSCIYQVNFVGFTCDRSVPMGSRPLPPGQPWVTPRTNTELVEEYAGWGSDVQHILECVENPSAWSIHFVQPPLDNYTRGAVALIGDAVGQSVVFSL